MRTLVIKYGIKHCFGNACCKIVVLNIALGTLVIKYSIKLYWGSACYKLIMVLKFAGRTLVIN